MRQLRGPAAEESHARTLGTMGGHGEEQPGGEGLGGQSAGVAVLVFTRECTVMISSCRNMSQPGDLGMHREDLSLD